MKEKNELENNQEKQVKNADNLVTTKENETEIKETNFFKKDEENEVENVLETMETKSLAENEGTSLEDVSKNKEDNVNAIPVENNSSNYNQDEIKTSKTQENKLENSIQKEQKDIKPSIENPTPNGRNEIMRNEDKSILDEVTQSLDKITQSNNKLILFGILGIVILVLTIIPKTFSSNSKSISTFKNSIQQEQYNEAKKIYDDKIKSKSKEKTEAINYLENYVEDITNNHLNGKIEYDKVVTTLESIKLLQILEVNKIEPFIDKVKRLNKLYEEALTMISKNELKEAMEVLNEIIKEHSNYKDTQKLLEDSVSKIKELLLIEVDTLTENHLYYEAIIKLENLLKIIPDDKDVLAKIKEIEEKIKIYKKTLLEDVKKLEDNQLYNKALTKLNEGLKIFKDDLDILSKKKDIEQKVNDYKLKLITKIDVIIQNKLDTEYDNALSMLEEALNVIGDDKDVLDRIEIIEVNKAIYEAEQEIINKEDYLKALDILKKIQKKYPTNSILKKAIEDVEKRHIRAILLKVKPVYEQRKYQEALNILEEGIKLYPNNEQIQKFIEWIKDRLPKLLQDLIFFTGVELKTKEYEIDNIENTQINVIDLVEFTNTYKINGKIEKITGTLFQPFGSRSNYNTCLLKIYGDGRELYVERMRGGITPISFEVDLTDINHLEVHLYKEDRWGYAPHAKLANVLLYSKHEEYILDLD